MTANPLLLLALLLAQPAVPATAPASPEGAAPWDPRAAEHLINRAGFGARPGQIERAVALGREALVERLLAGLAEDAEPFYAGRDRRPSKERLEGLTPAERTELIADYRREDQEQMVAFAAWWIDAMIASRHPLRERMVLFWHGHFTSSYREVRDSRAMIAQNELFRAHALGSFADLAHAIVRDPAMLEYLDNNSNRRGQPNENLARELMELFMLGEGNYTEKDVKEAARALTGWYGKGNEFRIRAGRHDGGKKKILGRKERFDADGLVDLLLEQPACAEWLASRLLSYFEGRPAPAARVAAYAELLRANEYSIEVFLRRLFHDPGFYAEDVVGARISSPVDFLVGTCRRLGVEPPGRMVYLAAGYLGERLLDPPNVKGWEGGEAWMTTSRYIARGNVAGVLLGAISLEDVLADEPGPAPEDAAAMDMEMEGGRPKVPLDKAMKGMRKYRDLVRRPHIYLGERLVRRGVLADEEIVDALLDELLAVEPSVRSRDAALAFLRAERERAGLSGGELLEVPRRAEPILRRCAHVILSLPEAHLM